ncbi:type II secretion system protein J [bacterium]
MNIKNFFRTNKHGVTLIELMIVVAIVGIVGFSIIRYFRGVFDSWFTIKDQMQVQTEARSAMDEMATFIRQSSNPVSGIIPAVGQGSTSYITFTYLDSSGDKNITYKRIDDTLCRFADGTTTAIISSGLENIYFNHISTYVVQISSLTVNFGRGRIVLDKSIYLRNQ